MRVVSFNARNFALIITTKKSNMNQLKFWHIALLLSIWSLTSCSDDNNENEAITPFCLGDTYYEVRLGQETNSIYITNGSGDISLAIEDENILQATYNGKLYADKPGGVVSLFGKQKGSTMLSIIDNVTGDKETIEVKVTDCYLAYVINDSNYPILPAGTTLFLVNNRTTIRDSILTNSERELYLCRQKESWVITSLCPMSIQRHGRVTRINARQTAISH